MRATVSGYSDYSYIYAALTSTLIFLRLLWCRAVGGDWRKMLQIIHPQLIAISKRANGCAGSSAAGNKQSNITSSYIMSGERPTILVGKQEDRAGITTIANMSSSFYLKEIAKLLI